VFSLRIEGVAMLVIQKLTKHFERETGFFSGGRKETVRAVDGVSFSLKRGETLGLVGESGSGKTTLGRLIIRLIEPTAGKILFEGRDITAYSRNEMREIRRHMQIIFQDPYSSLNPRLSIRAILEEPLEIFGIKSKERMETIERLLQWVGMDQECLRRFPHEFSGGQRQRIGIARALSLNPGLVVADEPVSALDVSIQAQVVNLLLDLQKKLNLSYLFISHDISVVRHMSHRIAVMYLGGIVEIGESSRICDFPLHPYTRALLAAVPDISDEGARGAPGLAGDIPNPVNPPTGCAFHPRCPEAQDICSREMPSLRDQDDGHAVSCHMV
jgi:oligopeptide/dipeptide ABC transporter ATP-binding protein